MNASEAGVVSTAAEASTKEENVSKPPGEEVAAAATQTAEDNTWGNGCDASQSWQEGAKEQEHANAGDEHVGSDPQAAVTESETMNASEAGVASTAAEASSKEENDSKPLGEEVAAAATQSAEDNTWGNGCDASQSWQKGAKEQDNANA